MSRRRLSTAVLLLLALRGASVSAESSKDPGIASTSPSVLFVFDASGSMMKKIQGRTKDEIARSVVSETLNSLPSGMQVGLVSFGHRAKGDCHDLEVVSPLGTDRAAVSQAVNDLKPKGETPLADAVRLAAAQFKDYEGKASVVVVSDGKEECGGDPCAAARDAVASGVHLQIHVVGFDVTAEEAKQLQCVAREGKGKYFSASSAKELSNALSEVQKEVVAQAPLPPPKAQAAAPAANILPRGGHGHGDAVALEPGDYVINWGLPSDVYEFWSFQVRAGQVINAVLRATPSGYTGGILYGPNHNGLVRDGCSQGSTLSWLTNSQQQVYTFYLSLGGCNGLAKGSGLTLSLKDAFDAESGTDAGDDFASARDIAPGKYDGFLAGRNGDDHRDFYRLKSVEAQSQVMVKVTPPVDVGYNVVIFDQDRAKVAEKASANPGAIARASWTTAGPEEEMFVLIEPRTVPDHSAVVPYTMEITVGQ